MSTFPMVVIILQLVISFLPNNASSPAPKFSIMDQKTDTKNSSNTNGSCHPKIIQPQLKIIFELMGNRKINVIDLHIWIESDNNTMNKTRVLTGIKWANEVGRTLITLIAGADEYYNRIPLILVSFTNTLTAGVYGLNIVVPEEAMRCFSLRDNTSDHTIFYFLLRQLYHISGNKTDYNLCLPHNVVRQEPKYNCCTIVGPNEALICSDYSSVVTKMFSVILLITLSIACFLIFPVTLGYLGNIDKSEYYTISDSPISFSSILCFVLIEERGRISSFARKSMFALFMFVTTLPQHGVLLWIYIPSFMVLLAFLFYTSFSMSRSHDSQIVALPFNMKFWFRKFIKWAGPKETLEEQSLLLPSSPDKPINIFLFLLFLVLHLISIPFLCYFSSLIIFRHCYNKITGNLKNMKERLLFLLAIQVFFTYIAISIYNCLLLAFYCTVGLFLNGEIYSPYILPFCTIILYSWTKWRSSVEAKYLVLLTNIYKVCKESRVDGDECSNNATEISCTINTSRQRHFKIKRNDNDGEPIIEKKLYDYVREKLLPYDRILLPYFQGVFLIAIFGYFSYILMSLAETSGISSSVQTIGTIAATSLPFVFDFVWKKNSDEQNAANDIALQSKLKHILRVCKSNDTTGEIEVECTEEDILNQENILEELYTEWKISRQERENKMMEYETVEKNEMQPTHLLTNQNTSNVVFDNENNQY